MVDCNKHNKGNFEHVNKCVKCIGHWFETQGYEVNYKIGEQNMAGCIIDIVLLLLYTIISYLTTCYYQDWSLPVLIINILSLVRYIVGNIFEIIRIKRPYKDRKDVSTTTILTGNLFLMEFIMIVFSVVLVITEGEIGVISMVVIVLVLNFIEGALRSFEKMFSAESMPHVFYHNKNREGGDNL